MRGVRWLAVVVMLMLLAAPPGPPTHAQPAQADHLGAALAAMPRGAGAVAFTDWALIKRYLGVQSLTSASPADQRLRFMQSLTSGSAVFSALGADSFSIQAATWSWDSTDLVWEAGSQLGQAAPAYVLRFRDNFNFAPLVALFGKRGFTKSEYHGVTIYSRRPDYAADWLLSDPELGLIILNTAVLAGEHTLVLSHAQPEVRAILDTMQRRAPAFAGDPAVRGAGRTLGTAASAMVFSGPIACALFDPAKQHPAQRAEVLHALGNPHPYAALAIGYRDEQKRPVGLIVMQYAQAGTARTDLAARRFVAATDYRPGAPFVVTVQSAYVTGSDIVLRLRLSHDSPTVLVGMVLAGYMVLAAC